MWRAASEQVGIRPPKGVILYGEPGTGKTLLAKAVANQTSATFLRVVGSELIQKYLGDGPKLVRELFRVADDHSPTIVFIDEIDAVGSKRYDSQSGGTKEIQRTMLELLNQLDGFDERGDVKVIMATNKIESLDPALIRPGRIDRKIEFPLPDIKTKRHIFGIHTSRMTLNEDVDLEVCALTQTEKRPRERERRRRQVRECLLASTCRSRHFAYSLLFRGARALSYCAIYVLWLCFFSFCVWFGAFTAARATHPSRSSSWPRTTCPARTSRRCAPRRACWRSGSGACGCARTTSSRPKSARCTARRATFRKASTFRGTLDL